MGNCCTTRAPAPITPEQRERIDAILNYWFRPGWDRESDPEEHFELWYGFKSP